MEGTRRTVLIALGAASTLAGCLGNDDTDNGAGSDDDPPAATVQLSNHGQFGDILVGPDRRTLYRFDADEQHAGESACRDACADNWPPLTVDDAAIADDGVEAELSTFDRADGATQVAVDGWPLYYWIGDDAEGDVNGQAVEDRWWVLGPDGTEIREQREETDERPTGGGRDGY